MMEIQQEKTYASKTDTPIIFRNLTYFSEEPGALPKK